MPPSDAITPLASYGRKTSLSASVAIAPSASRYFCAIRYCAGLPAGAERLRDHLNRLRLGLRDAQPRLRLTFRRQNRRFLRAFRVDDLRLLLTFGAQNRRRLLAFRRRDDRAARPLRRHLLFHRQADFFGRRDVLQLDAHHLDAPLLRGGVERGAQLRVGRVARRQRVIEIELADDVAQRRQRQLLEAPAQVLHLVGGAHRIGDQVVDDRIHFHRHVVARDDRLRLDLRDLLAQIDRVAHRVEERARSC